MTRILFDESHEELLCSHSTGDDRDSDTWDTLRTMLEEMRCEIAVHSAEKGFLTEEILDGYDVLVIGAPAKPLDRIEIDCVTDFVQNGHGLLVASNVESLWRQNSNSLDVLLETFGVRFERSFYPPAKEITTIFPHYISSDVATLRVKEPTYLQILDDNPSVIAKLPWPKRAFLAAIETFPGRIVVAGDFASFGDGLISEHSNRRLALNIFRWLTHKNSLDCRNAQMSGEVMLGDTATFSIVLVNSTHHRLEQIHCLLESDSSARIESPVLEIRSIPRGSQTWLQWIIEPRRLGSQSIKLTVEFPEDPKQKVLFFDPAAEFECLPNAQINLVFLNGRGESTQTAVTGVPFEAKPTVEWAHNAERTALNWKLKYPRDHFVEHSQPTESGHWQLEPLDPGDWHITLTLPETGQSIKRLLRVRASKNLQIEEIEQDIVKPLAARIQLLVSQIRPEEFDSESIREIPFKVLTPEEYVRRIYPADAADRLLAGIRTARSERGVSKPLLRNLLRYIAPVYSPIHGCCVPYDPDLATHLVRKYELYEDNLANNFLYVEGKDPIWVEQNIAAFLLHEKYGHGFFYRITTLGQQLAILYNHGFLRQEDRDRLSSPYPRSLAEEYKEPIDALSDSAIIVNEGFAAYMELLILPRLGGSVGQATYRRKDFLMTRDDELQRTQESSQYFREYTPFRASRYQEGYDYLRLIQGYFGDNYGPRCAIQAMIKASDVNVGITESGKQVVFGLSAEKFKWTLFEDSADDARADIRLRKIHSVLRQYREQVRADQRDLQCYRVCLHQNCPVDRIINQQLGW